MSKKRNRNKKRDKPMTRDEAAKRLIELCEEYERLDAQEKAITAKLMARIDELKRQGYYVDESEWL